MSELQSNAAFHLSQNPLKCVNHIVLPPYLIYGIAARTFWCIVHGSSRPFEITVHSNHNIDDVKKDIISQEIILRHITHSSLVLWKLNVPEPVTPTSTLWQRIRNRGDVEAFAEQLADPTQTMLSVFPQSQLPLENHVYILVELPSDESRSWLAVMHHKLWRDDRFFGRIFRTVTLTKDHFAKLQDLLDEEDPGRTSDPYVAKDVLTEKSEFLRKNSDPLETDFGNGIVPRLVFDASQPPSSVGVVDNEDDTVANDVDGDVADDAMDIDGYADSHMDHLSNEATAIFPYTIRYVDLTVLNLKSNLRVPLLMLFRNEWGCMIDIFNRARGSAVFTGQPGIGKTCLLYSILILSMIRGERFMFQDTFGKVFIIDNMGVHAREEGVSHNTNLNVLGLVDADVKCFEPDVFLWNNSKHRVLLTSSPRSRDDRKWLKQIQNQNAVYTMKPWSREELVVATLFLQKTDITLKRLQEASLICGNIPRTCFEAAASPADLRQAGDDITNAIEQIEDLFRVAVIVQNGNKSQITHRAFQVRPASSENRFWGKCVAEPVSAWAFSKMLNVLHKRNRTDAYKFYCMIKAYPDSSQLCGRIFESYLHPFLKHPRTFVIRSFDNRTDPLNIDFNINTDNYLSFTDLSPELVLSVKSDRSRYLWPDSPVLPSFDSFLYQPKISNSHFSPLIALLVTTAAKHDIKLKGLQEVQRSLQDPCLENLRPTNPKKMIILFVVPDDLEKTFKTQNIYGAKNEAQPWYDKTAQYVLGIEEKALFEVYGETQ